MTLTASLAGRFMSWWARFAAASLLLAIVQLLMISVELVSAASSAAGASQTLALLTAVCFAPGVLLAAAFTLLNHPRVLRLLPGGGAVAIGAVFLLVASLPWGMLDALLDAPQAEFAEPVAELRWVGRLLVGSALLVAFGLLAGIRAWGAGLPRLWQRRLAAGSAVVASLIGSWLAQRVLARVHESSLAALAGLAALALGAVALAAAGWPRRAIESHVTLVASTCVALLGAYLPGTARDHARFVVWGHSSLAGVAEAERTLLDWDGDAVLPAWLAGGGDCAGSNARISPLELEIPGDGVDQDCRGGDAPARGADPPREPLRDCAISEQRRDVVVLLVDALRYDAVTPATMPALSELARGSLVFERAYSPTVMTFTSVSAIFSGRPFADVGPKNALLDEQITPDATLAERFLAAGYRTAAFSDYFEHRAFRRGFERVNDYWHDLEVAGVKGQLTSAAKVQGVLAFLEREQRPSFVWAHLIDTHAPYPFGYASVSSGADALAYYRSAAYVDRQLGRFFLALRERGRLDSTIVAVIADHGEELLERGRLGHGPNLFEESIHVPLVLWAPGCKPRRIAQPVSLAHLAGSLGQLANVATPGLDLLGRRDLPIVVEAVTGLNTTFKRAVIRGRYKLMVDVTNGGRMLFDLEQDPAELTDVLSERATVAAELERDYQRWLDAPGRR